jgi:uncharacterized membrane protein
MTDADRIRERENVANRLEKMVRHTPVLLAPLALVAVVDLVTGSVTGDSRIDVVLLLAAAAGLWSAYSTRRLAGRFRRDDFPQRATPLVWARAVISLAASFGFCAGVGYLIGGWVAAVVLPTAMTILIAVSFASGRRRRRRVLAERKSGLEP